MPEATSTASPPSSSIPLTAAMKRTQGRPIIVRPSPKSTSLEIGGLKFANRFEAKAATVTKEIQDAIAGNLLQVIADNPPPRILKAYAKPTVTSSDGAQAL